MHVRWILIQLGYTDDTRSQQICRDCTDGEGEQESGVAGDQSIITPVGLY